MLGSFTFMQSSPVPYQPVNHVFVDLENVKTLDVEVLGGKNLTFHLFMGPHQKKLDVEVVEVLLENAQAVRLVRSPKHGKNALDLVLAYHLGQAVLGDPKGYFHIISKDAGFDAMVDLLKAKHVKVKRHDSWSDLHFNGPPKPETAAKPATPPKTPAPGTLTEDAEKLLANLRKTPSSRPKKQKGLLSRVSNLLGNGKSEAQCQKIMKELVDAGKLSVDVNEAVVYAL